MVMYEIHSHPVLQKYKSHICSRASVFQLFIAISTVLFPLLVAYASQGINYIFIYFDFFTIIWRLEKLYKLQKSSDVITDDSKLRTLLIDLMFLVMLFRVGFWLKEASYKEQPEVHFKHQFVVLLQGITSNSYVAYSTYQNFNNLVNDKLRIPVVKVINWSSTERKILKCAYVCACHLMH